MSVSEPDLSCRSILVVDDDPDVRDAIASVLGDEGYGVTSVGNGREALEHLHHRTRPSLILLDTMMPEMDGWSFRQELKKLPELSSIPIVILSAPSQNGSARERRSVERRWVTPSPENSVRPPRHTRR